MAKTTRDDMIAGAITLVRQNGVAGTSIRDVVEFTGTPRGSVSHHFPGGKHELMEQAVRRAGEEVFLSLAAALEAGLLVGLGGFIDAWAEFLHENDFNFGCAVLAAALAPDGGALASTADEYFKEWESALTRSLKQEGVPKKRAESMSTLIVAALEGAIVMSRAARNMTPLMRVKSEIVLLLDTALEN